MLPADIDATDAPRVVLDSLTIGESPRWHDGRLWVCNWGAAEVVAVDVDGSCERMLDAPSGIPFCIDWLPDGRLLLVSGGDGKLLRREPDGSLEVHGDLTGVSHGAWNEVVVDGLGNAYVNGAGFDMMAGEPFAPGVIALVAPDGRARQVADDLRFPNGMAMTPDERTLIVAESYGRRLTAFDVRADGGLEHRRVWASLGDGVPDGICLDAEGAIWYADVPNRRCVRVAEGGEVLGRVDADRGCFACMLGGADGRTLFVVAAHWRGADAMFAGERTGQVLVARAPAPAAGRP
jgi:sugar lactone lactonase YvrE